MSSKPVANLRAPKVEVLDGVLPRGVFARLATALNWVPMYHVRRTDRDPAADPLDSYWYYPLAVVEDRYKDDASGVLNALDAEFQPVKDAWVRVARAIGRPVRLYESEFTVNGFGNEGHPHYDVPPAKLRSRHITAVVYCNTEWSLSWAGETVVFDKRKDVMAAVLPKPGRATVIHGDPLHVARGVARICPVPRRVLVFKMWALD